MRPRRVAKNDENGRSRVDSKQGPDPQWNLAVDITLQLRLHGAHRIVIHDCTDQRLVDVRWAVLQAGRMLGSRPRILLDTPPGLPSTTLVVTITAAEAPAAGSAQALVGLSALLRSVRDEQSRSCTTRRPIPRQGATRRTPVAPVG